MKLFDSKSIIRRNQNKITNLEKLSNELTKKKDSTVLVGGVFDILHYGHFSLFQYTKQFGQTLIVCLQGDKQVKKRKGKFRPILEQKVRATNLANLDLINYVFISNRNVYDDYVLQKIQPNWILRPRRIHRSKKYYKIFEENLKKNFPKIKFHCYDEQKEISTTEIIEKVLSKNSTI